MRAYGRRPGSGRLTVGARQRGPSITAHRCKGHHAADPMAVCPEAGSVAVFTRLRPSSLARYSASSARATKPPAVSPGANSATPKLHVTVPTSSNEADFDGGLQDFGKLRRHGAVGLGGEDCKFLTSPSGQQIRGTHTLPNKSG